MDIPMNIAALGIIYIKIGKMINAKSSKSRETSPCDLRITIYPWKWLTEKRINSVSVTHEYTCTM